MKPQGIHAKGRPRNPAVGGVRAPTREARDGAVSSLPKARAGTSQDPREPSSYPRRILLAVTGLSPQVVTETLYYLAVKQQPRWIPTEIQLITTVQGAEHARLNLLSEQIGWFHRLRHDYKLPEIAFNEEHICVIPDNTGTGLEDIRTPEQNTRTADFITDFVRTLTADPQSAIHVSIAGGRKTMGYYLGYALSLFGRAQDHLSHVLVSAPYENNREFYYPTPYEYAIHVQQNGKDVAYDCRRAEIDLAEIPFVRLREGLSEDLKDLQEGKVSFSQAVEYAQRALPPPSLILEPSSFTVIASEERIQLKRALFAFYWLFAERCKNGLVGAHWTENDFSRELLDYYGRLVNPHSGTYGHARDKLEKRYTKDNFDPAKSHINKAFVRALGMRRATPYQIVPLKRIPGTRYHRFGLKLPADAIRIL